MQVGIASLYVASKCEEYYPADLKKLVHLTENSYQVQDVFDMELVLLGVIHFQVCSIPDSFCIVVKNFATYTLLFRCMCRLRQTSCLEFVERP